MAMAVTPVSTRVFTAPSVSPRASVSSNRTLSLAFSSSSNHASMQLSLMTKYSFSSWKSVARSPQAAMATSVSQSTHRIADIMATLKVQGKVIEFLGFFPQESGNLFPGSESCGGCSLLLLF
jgi:hypothetical protein